MGLEVNPIEETPHLQPGEIVNSPMSGKKPCIYDDEAVCLAPHKLRFEICKACPRAFQYAPPNPVKHLYNYIKSFAVSLIEFMGV
jgi:hypothetical protein